MGAPAITLDNTLILYNAILTTLLCSHVLGHHILGAAFQKREKGKEGSYHQILQVLKGLLISHKACQWSIEREKKRENGERKEKEKREAVVWNFYI